MARRYEDERIIGCRIDNAYSFCRSACEATGLQVVASDMNLGTIVARLPGRFVLGVIDFSNGVDVTMSIMPSGEDDSIVAVHAESRRTLLLPRPAEWFNEAEKTVKDFWIALDYILQRRGISSTPS